MYIHVLQNTYANVINLKACNDVTITGIRAGHHAQPGACTGGVLNLIHTNSVSVGDCFLYGCGTYGVTLDTCGGDFRHNKTRGGRETSAACFCTVGFTTPESDTRRR